MKSSQTVKRYAKTLFDVAASKSVADDVHKDMTLLSDVFVQTKELGSFFSNPLTTNQQVEKLIETSFSKKFQPLTLTFIKLLFKKNRIDILKDIPEIFVEFYEKQNNIIRATVTSAQKLSPEQLEKIKQKLKTSFQSQKFTIENQVDEKLIAGFQLRINDMIIDANVKSKLRQLRRKLAA